MILKQQNNVFRRKEALLGLVAAWEVTADYYRYKDFSLFHNICVILKISFLLLQKDS